MSTLSIPPLLMSAVTFYVGIYHFLIYIQKREDREHLTFALSCAAIGLYDVFSAGLYNSTTAVEGGSWYHYQALAGSLFGLFYLLFVRDYLKIKNTKIIHTFAGFFAVSSLVTVFGKDNWVADITKPSVKEVNLPFDLTIIYREVEPGLWTNIIYLAAAAGLLYIIYLAVREYRTGSIEKARPLIYGTIFLFCCSTNDGAVAAGLFKSVYLFEYGYLVLTILMGYSLTREIVEAARLKDVVKESEALFRAITENTTDVTSILDERGHFKYISPAIGDFGFAPGEIVGKHFTEFIHPEDLPTVAKYVAKSIDSNLDPYSVEDVRLRLGEKTYHTESMVTSMIDIPGVGGYVVHSRDITDRLKAEQQLSKIESIFKAAMDNLPHDSWIIDSEGKYILQNMASRKLWGDIIGRTPEEIAGEGENLRLWLDNNRRAFAGEVIEGEVELKVDGRNMHFLNIIAPIYNNEEVIGILGFNIDISDAKRSEQAMKQAYEELQQIDKLKNDFLSNISHELRTPLVAVKGYIELLISERETDPETARNWLQIAHNAAIRLESIISDLFDISRMQFGKIKFEFRSVDLAGNLAKCIEDLAPRFDENRIEVKLEIEPDLPPAKADSGKLKSVVLNLIDNALKFSDPDSQILVTAKKDPSAEGFILVGVKDSGIGIDEQFRDKIFDKFFQIDSSSTRKYEGAGIGLALAKDIIESHGGSIRVESKIGAGAHFLFSVPVFNESDEINDASVKEEFPAQNEKKARGLRTNILVIDDDDEIRTLLKTALADEFNVAEAADGPAGLARAAEISPEIILLDLAMPGMDGFEVCRKLKNDPATCNIEVLIFSARTSEHEKELATEAGADLFIEKPIPINNLKKILLTHKLKTT